MNVEGAHNETGEGCLGGVQRTLQTNCAEKLYVKDKDNKEPWTALRPENNIVPLINDSYGEVWKQGDQEGTIVIISQMRDSNGLKQDSDGRGGRHRS